MPKNEKNKPVKYSTVVLDTSTEVETILRQATFEDIRAGSDKFRERMAPNEYTLRNLRMAALFDSAKDAGINLVSVQYMKEKWDKDSKGNFYNTGEMVIDGWQRTETQADVNVELNGKELVIASNRFEKPDDFGYNMRLSEYDSYDNLATYLLANFYGDDEEYPNLVVSVTGRAKTGKTHFAFTFPEPIKVYCFNRGADFVKKRFPKKHIDIVNYSTPIIDELNPKPWAEPIWKSFYRDFKKTLEEAA